MRSIPYGYRGIPGNCRADELARRGTTNELSDEFSYLVIPMRSCKIIIDNANVDSVNDRWAASDTGRTAHKIWLRLDEGRTISLFKLQRGVLSLVVGVFTGHCIMGTHARRIGLGHLANDLCRDEETVPYRLITCPTFCQRRKK